MRILFYLLIASFSLFADTNSGGRPNPAGIDTERVTRLDHIDRRIEAIQKDIDRLEKKIEFLIWLLDGSIYSEHPSVHPH